MYIAEVNRTDDDCEQQSPSVAVRLQQLTTTPAEKIVIGLQQTAAVWHWRQCEHEAVLIFSNVAFETRISAQRSV